MHTSTIREPGTNFQVNDLFLFSANNMLTIPRRTQNLHRNRDKQRVFATIFQNFLTKFIVLRWVKKVYNFTDYYFL